MEAEHLVLDDSGKGKEIEQFGELLPDVGISVLAKAFIVEAISMTIKKDSKLISFD